MFPNSVCSKNVCSNSVHVLSVVLCRSSGAQISRRLLVGSGLLATGAAAGVAKAEEEERKGEVSGETKGEKGSRERKGELIRVSWSCRSRRRGAAGRGEADHWDTCCMCHQHVAGLAC
jgi:hypothetical protein